MRKSAALAGITLASLTLAGCTHSATPTPTPSPSTPASASPSASPTLSATELSALVISANASAADVFDHPLHITHERTATASRGGERQEQHTHWAESTATTPFLYELAETENFDGESHERLTYAEEITDPGLGEGIALYTSDNGADWVKEFESRDDFSLRAGATGEARRLALHLDAISSTEPESLESSCSATTCTITAHPTGEVRDQIAQSLFGNMLEAADGPFETESLTLKLTVDADTYLIRSFDFHTAGSSEASDGTVDMTLSMQGSIDTEAGAPNPLPDAARAANFG